MAFAGKGSTTFLAGRRTLLGLIAYCGFNFTQVFGCRRHNLRSEIDVVSSARAVSGQHREVCPHITQLRFQRVIQKIRLFLERSVDSVQIGLQRVHLLFISFLPFLELSCSCFPVVVLVTGGAGVEAFFRYVRIIRPNDLHEMIPFRHVA